MFDGGLPHRHFPLDKMEVHLLDWTTFQKHYVLQIINEKRKQKCKKGKQKNTKLFV